MSKRQAPVGSKRSGARDTRRLLLMRHAKAAWPDGVDDHARPLAGRGRTDAPQVGAWLEETGWVPDLIVSSDATRTRQTTALIVEGLGRQVPVCFVHDLYECDIAGVLDVVNRTAAGVRTLLLVGHEPTMSATTTVITGRQVRFPTAAIARIEIPVPWAGVEGGTGDLIGVRTPKD